MAGAYRHWLMMSALTGAQVVAFVLAVLVAFLLTRWARHGCGFFNGFVMARFRGDQPVFHFAPF